MTLLLRIAAIVLVLALAGGAFYLATWNPPADQSILSETVVLEPRRVAGE